ncbi:tetratricopeptide repeat protein [Campylobacter geochelonis]|uniref:tetratricopeptide repeat protein n=1 Tax=Campylobacter geochelonis TaxID=1780362 RepID=UPI0007707D65|nr:tetratricopeptide repeat protein [Campylobacter geochelonis]CZE49860.1 carbamoyl-phosphate synthase large subunit [Campylobacter geochelonis]
MKKLIIGAILSITFLFANNNALVDKANEAYDLGDFDTAAKLYEEAGNDPYATHMRGLMLLWGIGPLSTDIEKDMEKAIELFEISVNGGNSEAMVDLGALYDEGSSLIEANHTKAKKLYEKAIATNGHVYAYHNLAMMYSEGRGVEQNDKKALELLEKAAEKGYLPSQREVGDMYKNGIGTQKDEAKALKWYEKAAEQGDAFAQNDVGLMYHYGLGTKIDYKKAMYWYEKAAEQRSSRAIFNIGLLYEKGLGVDKDLDKARDYYKKACQTGYQKACDVANSF